MNEQSHGAADGFKMWTPLGKACKRALDPLGFLRVNVMLLWSRTAGLNAVLSCERLKGLHARCRIRKRSFPFDQLCNGLGGGKPLLLKRFTRGWPRRFNLLSVPRKASMIALDSKPGFLREIFPMGFRGAVPRRRRSRRSGYFSGPELFGTRRYRF